MNVIYNLYSTKLIIIVIHIINTIFKFDDIIRMNKSTINFYGYYLDLKGI